MWQPLWLSFHALTLLLDLLPRCAAHVQQRTLEALRARLAPSSELALDYLRLWRAGPGVATVLWLALRPPAPAPAAVPALNTPPVPAQTAAAGAAGEGGGGGGGGGGGEGEGEGGAEELLESLLGVWLGLGLGLELGLG